MDASKFKAGQLLVIEGDPQGEVGEVLSNIGRTLTIKWPNVTETIATDSYTWRNWLAKLRTVKVE